MQATGRKTQHIDEIFIADCRAGVTGSRLAFCTGSSSCVALGAQGQQRVLRRRSRCLTPGAVVSALRRLGARRAQSAARLPRGRRSGSRRHEHDPVLPIR